MMVCYPYADDKVDDTIYSLPGSESWLSIDCLKRRDPTLPYPTLSASRIKNASPPIYSFALGPSIVGRSRSLMSPAASLSQKLMRSLPNPLLTMLN